MTTDTLHAGVLPKQPSMRRLIVAATIGNVFEWFDFVVYGFFAVTLAEVFFPTGNPTVSLLVTFGAFGLAYLVRPLGAIVVGGYTDHDRAQWPHEIGKRSEEHKSELQSRQYLVCRLLLEKKK